MHNGLRELLAILQRMDSAVVAFSGGVDSTLLLKVARSAISGKVIAATSASATIASEDLAFAKQMASFIGVEHYLVETEEIHDSRFTSNPPNRCYYCKSGLFDKLSAFAKAQGILFILDGSNAEDLDDFRPGRKAALEAGVRSPLLEAGLGKAEIRAISKELGLPAWDRPASPCLASRFPYGHQITVESLKQVEKAEGFLRTLGFEQFRVRHYGELARIEVLLSDFSRIVKDETRQKILFFFKSCGYREITLDLEGFRSGRLNEVLEHRNF